VREVDPNAVSSNGSETTVNTAAVHWSLMLFRAEMVNPISTDGFERIVVVAMIAP
jgi:hypothetical protein